MKSNQIIIVVLAILCMHSCTIEKRRYMDGYHVDWKHRHDRLSEKGDSKDDAEIHEQSEIKRQTLNVAMNEVQNIEQQPSSETVSVQKVVSSNPVLSSKENAKRSSTWFRHPSIRRTPAFHAFQSSLSITHEKQMDEEEILLVILAIFIPPLAVFLHEGSWNTTCWINLVLTLLFLLPGIIHALIVILS